MCNITRCAFLYELKETCSSCVCVSVKVCVRLSHFTCERSCLLKSGFRSGEASRASHFRAREDWEGRPGDRARLLTAPSLSGPWRRKVRVEGCLSDVMTHGAHSAPYLKEKEKKRNAFWLEAAAESASLLTMFSQWTEITLNTLTLLTHLYGSG